MNQDAFHRANQARKQDTRNRLDYYHDQHDDLTLEELRKHFSEPENMQLACLNVVKKVVNNLAQVYRQEPKRQIEGTDRDRDIFAEIAETAALDVKLKQASRYAKLLKTIMLRPVWRNGRLDLDVLTGDILDVATGDTPEEIEAVRVTHQGDSTRYDEVTYSLWTADSVKRLDWRYRVTEEEPNPYGVIPFIPIFDYSPTSDFWLPGGDDLISIQTAINTKLTDLLHVIQHQAFGVGYIKGGFGGGMQRLDPATMVQLPENGEIGFVSQQAEIEDVRDSIDFIIKQAAVTNGLSAASLSIDPVQASGVSKLADSKELAEMRQDDIALFRRYEKQLFELVRIVWNAHNPTRTISDKATLTVDFADPKPMTSPKEQAETWNLLLEMGVASPVDIIMERNPDLTTREEAKAFLIQLQTERLDMDQ